ncbi:helix-turn-helix transcriptional regulator [Paraburkholderia sp. JPY419]|uniref:helix-turn-helix transcriptional regulator n=1 Tax=Paraburkholderia sp. JPY419 TaxID=667660 RepID=UPI003D1DBE15
MDHLLALAEVRQCVGGLGQSTLYRLMQLGQFPKPVPLGVGNRVAWRESDVQQWIADRIAAALTPTPDPHIAEVKEIKKLAAMDAQQTRQARRPRKRATTQPTETP